MLEGPALHELHREEHCVRPLPHIEDGNHVGVGERCQRLRFADQSQDEALVWLVLRVKQLQCDPAVQLCVPRCEHCAHASAPRSGHDLVSADACALSKAQRFCSRQGAFAGPTHVRPRCGITVDPACQGPYTCRVAGRRGKGSGGGRDLFEGVALVQLGLRLGEKTTLSTEPAAQLEGGSGSEADRGKHRKRHRSRHHRCGDEERDGAPQPNPDEDRPPPRVRAKPEAVPAARVTPGDAGYFFKVGPRESDERRYHLELRAAGKAHQPTLGPLREVGEHDVPAGRRFDGVAAYLRDYGDRTRECLEDLFP